MAIAINCVLAKGSNRFSFSLMKVIFDMKKDNKNLNENDLSKITKIIMSQKSKLYFY